VEQVSRIALAILARGIAAVDAAVGDDALGRNDVTEYWVNQCGAPSIIASDGSSPGSQADAMRRHEFLLASCLAATVGIVCPAIYN
jgi:hypothetical protein